MKEDEDKDLDPEYLILQNEILKHKKQRKWHQQIFYSRTTVGDFLIRLIVIFFLFVLPSIIGAFVFHFLEAIVVGIVGLLWLPATFTWCYLAQE